MNEVRRRPTFAKEQLDKELKQVVLLDRILAEKGALTLKQLYDIASQIDKRNNFENLASLTTFVKKRTNVFETSFDRVRNRCQEFREMFGYLVNSFCEKEPAERNVALASQAIGYFGTIVLYEVGEDVRQFLSKHKNFFIVYDNESDIVMLNPACLQIPSAWERGALPTYEECLRYDKSIVMNGIGRVVSAITNTRYIKIEIVRGRWKKQTIFGLSKNVSNEENLADKFPVGSLVKVMAHRAYEAAQPWTAIKVSSASDSDDIWSVGETGRMDNLLAKYQYNEKEETSSGREVLTEQTPVVTDGNATPKFTVESINGNKEEAGAVDGRINYEEETSMNSDDWKFYNNIIHDEIKKCKEVDECLKNGAQTFHDIFDNLMERDTFAYYSHMVDFITVRTHLYEVSEDRVCMRNKIYREEMLKFLCFIDEKYRKKVNVNTLRKLVRANNAGFVEEIVGFAENAEAFLRFIEQHSSLIELAEAFGEQFIFLRGWRWSHEDHSPISQSHDHRFHVHEQE